MNERYLCVISLLLNIPFKFCSFPLFAYRIRQPFVDMMRFNAL